MNFAPTSSLAAVILAAGASARMGKPKLLLPWGGTTIVGHLINQWRALGAVQIGIVCREDDALLHTELDRLGFPSDDRIGNPRPEAGMFSSILCAARWGGWKTDPARWAIVLGDQPHLKSGSLQKLTAFHQAHPDSICQPVFGGHGGHPVILPRHHFRRLSETSAASLKDFLRAESAGVLRCPIEDPGLAIDLDTPEDYMRASAERENGL